MIDPFASHNAGASAPLTRGFAVIPSDTVDLPYCTRQIRVTGAGGTVCVIWQDGGETVEPVFIGDVLNWRIVRVKATGTTAAGIRGYI